MSVCWHSGLVSHKPRLKHQHWKSRHLRRKSPFDGMHWHICQYSLCRDRALCLICQLILPLIPLTQFLGHPQVTISSFAQPLEQLQPRWSPTHRLSLPQHCPCCSPPWELLCPNQHHRARAEGAGRAPANRSCSGPSSLLRWTGFASQGALQRWCLWQFPVFSNCLLCYLFQAEQEWAWSTSI